MIWSRYLIFGYLDPYLEIQGSYSQTIIALITNQLLIWETLLKGLVSGLNLQLCPS